MKKRWSESTSERLLAALLPILMMGGYFALRGVYPFGGETLLTVDLGQQYIDFYALFRQTLLGDPGQFFFGWNKALGGDMVGVWAYYLMSPFNLIFLLTPKTSLDVGVLVITLLKYGAAGLTLNWWLQTKPHLTRGFRLGLSTSYALSGWMLANQLNLMWLDVVVWLPLVVWGLERLMTTGRFMMLTCWLAVTIITNYYMGFMVCLFVGLLALYQVMVLPNIPRVKRLIQTTLAGMLGVGLSGFILLPTVFQLGQSKGTYTKTDFSWQLEYAPWKVLGKFVAGSFDFDQMPSGQPNLYVGVLVTFLTVLFFFQRGITWKNRLAAGFISTILGLSVILEPLDLLWHGMQFPVWYPYRFSFVLIMWAVILAVQTWPLLQSGIVWWQLAGLALLWSGLCGYLWVNLSHFSYLTTSQIALSFLLGLMLLVALSIRHDATKATGLLFMMIMVVDAGSNAAITLNQLSYISHHDYHTYTEALRQAVKPSATHRVGKTTLRTKNDAMQLGFFGTDQFNSMMEPDLPRFFGQIGQAAGDGFVAYTNGTLITDSLLGIRQWLAPRYQAEASTFLPALTPRPDLPNLYESAGHTKAFDRYQNPYALSLGIMSNAAILDTKLVKQSPVVNQELMMSHLLGERYTPLFDVIPMTQSASQNVTIKDQSATKTPGKQPATVTYRFKVESTAPLYLMIPASYTDRITSLTLNKHPVAIYDTFRDPLLLNVTPQMPGGEQELTFTVNKDSLDLSWLRLYQLNQSQAVTMLNRLRQTEMQNVKRTARSLSGTVDATAKQRVLLLTVPNRPGWRVEIDGKRVKPKTALGLFMAIPLKEGPHHLSMRYTPPLWWQGVACSLVALLLCLSWWWQPLGRHRA